MMSTQGDQVNTISGGATAELNYVSSTIQPTVVGPQLSFDKNQLCMMTPVTVTAQDQVVLKNTGSTTVTYDWKKVIRGDFIQSKCSDGIQRFYCHYPHGVLKPGESKTFTFSFRSADKPGMFFEEWELLTDPQLLTPLPIVYLSGIATLNDDVRQNMLRERKSRVETEIGDHYTALQSARDASKVEGEVEKSPREKIQEMRNPKVFAEMFEKNNSHLGLYFSQRVMDEAFELIDDIISRAAELQQNPDEVYLNWNGNLEYVENLLSFVENPYSKASFTERYMKCLSNARKVPIEKAQSFSVLRTMLLQFSELTVDFEQKARDELQTIANPGFVVPHEAMTPEEMKKAEEERKLKKADWYKATKKKPKTDDEEAQEAEEIRTKTQNALKHELLANRLTKIGREIDILKTKWLMDNHLTMDRKEYDDLYHLESVLDIDVAGKDIIVRLDLDVPLSHYVPPAGSESQMGTHHEDVSKSQGTNTKQSTKKGGKQSESEQHTKRQEEPWRRREILDHTLLKRAANELRYLTQERMANRTFVLGNLAERTGRVKPENSMRIVHNTLQKLLPDQGVAFLDDAVIPDFEQKKENEVFPEQTTFILENLNFKPDEFGYVEPEKPAFDEHAAAAASAAEEEAKRLEEEKLAAAQKGKPGAPPPKAPAPADKKKEEEAKKKAEEEAAAAKRKSEEAVLAASGGKVLSEEEKAEQHRQKEEAERLKREAEYFDYKTIHKFKGLLGRYGEIYVNDAPLMSLTNSNSISEIKSKRKVLGVKMTEELRKLCLFFLKKHPKDILDLWYTQPTPSSYHDREFTALVGGTIHSVQDLLDRILLVNALLDQTNTVYLGGQFGLAALHALGVKVGHVDGGTADWEQCSEFFHTVFHKAVMKKAKIYFPKDFVIASQADIEHAKHEQAEYEQKVQQELMKQQMKTHESQQNTTNSKSKTKGGVTSGAQNTGGSQTGLQQQTPVEHAGHDQQSRSWVERLQQQGKAKEVKLTEKIAKLWNDVVKQVYNKYVEQGVINKETDPAYRDHPLTQQSVFFLASAFTQHQSAVSATQIQDVDQSVISATSQSLHAKQQEILQQQEAALQHQSSLVPDVKSDEQVLDFGEETRAHFFKMLHRTFKLLWDGSLSPLPAHSQATNKSFVEALLDLRIQSQNDEEPPVTCLHAPETQEVVRSALLRIKVEQAEAAEEAKRKAKEAKLAARLARGDDDEEEEEEEEEPERQETMTQGDQSMGEGQSEEMQQIADFLVFDIPQFTTKVMQGVVIKSLLATSKHRRKPKQEVAEELFLLDEI